MERSKAGLPVDGPITSLPAAATVALPSSDPLTQILMSVYFFLAGVAVSTSRVLWLLPLATALSAALYSISATASRWILPFYPSLTPDRASLWNLQAVHLMYSMLAAACAAWHAITNPSALILTAPQPSAALPQALAAASAGFFGFVLWTEVGDRLYKRNYAAVLHYTVVLVLFSAAAYKSLNTSFLVVTLLAEINTVILMLRRQAAVARMDSKSFITRSLAIFDALTFVVCRLVPHAALGATVWNSFQAFPTPGTYYLAAGGMAYMNAANVKHAVSFLRGSRQGNAKQHAA